MSDSRPVAAIEAAAAESWPPAEVARRDGWTLNASGGFSRRANCATPPSGPVGDLRVPARWFAARGLPFVVRVTPPVAGADRVLEAAGFGKESATEVMTLDLAGHFPTGTEVEIAGEPTQEWLAAESRLQRVPDVQRASWSGIIGRIERPAAFALLRDDGTPVAAGFAVRVGPLVGAFEINVAAGHRRRGIGSAITAALLDWGRAEGAGTAFLQVSRDNPGALALYGTLGFRPLYRYWYRRAPT